jgi:hypothetical protein
MPLYYVPGPAVMNRSLRASAALLAIMLLAAMLLDALPLHAADNELSAEEREAGWLLLFDGKTLDGWTTNTGQPSRTPVQEGALNPHGCGGYMLIHEKDWADFELVLEFKISPGCNSGVFFRTYPLTPRPGKDVGFNGLEIAIDDTTGDGYHDTGAIYDLVRPTRNAMRSAGEWNHLRLLCQDNLIEVELNGEVVSRMDLDEWTEPNRRPDGTPHKFDVAYKEHPRHGYIGLQDHGADCWFKNIKLRPLNDQPEPQPQREQPAEPQPLGGRSAKPQPVKERPKAQP